jgi:hypothetical protein
VSVVSRSQRSGHPIERHVDRLIAIVRLGAVLLYWVRRHYGMACQRIGNVLSALIRLIVQVVIVCKNTVLGAVPRRIGNSNLLSYALLFNKREKRNDMSVVWPAVVSFDGLVQRSSVRHPAGHSLTKTVREHSMWRRGTCCFGISVTNAFWCDKPANRVCVKAVELVTSRFKAVCSFVALAVLAAQPSGLRSVSFGLGSRGCRISQSIQSRCLSVMAGAVNSAVGSYRGGILAPADQTRQSWITS